MDEGIKSGCSQSDDYYLLLGISSNATQEEIKEAYRNLAKEYHPDRPAQLNEIDRTSIFSKISQAYSVLSVPISRSLYDIAQGYKRDSPDVRHEINMMKRRIIEKQQCLYESTVNEIRAKEEKRNGLVILEAQYGDIYIDDVSTSQEISIDTNEKVGKCIDVTNAIQCMVDNSALIIHDGGTKAWLEGFYDPNDNLVKNLLYVRYKFQNNLHEVIVEDNEELCLPLEEHLIADDEQDALCLLETLDTDISSDVNPDDDNEIQAAIERANIRKEKKKLIRKSLRSTRRVRPRSQEVYNIKYTRRRNLYLSLGLFFISVTTYYSHQQQFIDFFKLPLIRILANFIGLSKNHTPSLTYTQSGDAQNISLPIKSELIREESIPGQKKQPFLLHPAKKL